jgi:hypothetical protein
MRALSGNCYLGIEHNQGHIPLGEGGDDYKPGGRMQNFDVIFGEFDDSPDPNTGNDSIWQICGRMIRPYNRPPDQPGNDDPNPPFYMNYPNPRGQFYYVGFEYSFNFGAYAWVRVDMNNYVGLQNAIGIHRNYMKALGSKYNG